MVGDASVEGNQSLKGEDGSEHLEQERHRIKADQFLDNPQLFVRNFRDS